MARRVARLNRTSGRGVSKPENGDYAAAFVVPDICNTFRELSVSAAVNTERAWYLLHNIADAMPIATAGTFYDAQTYRRVASTQRWFWIAVTSPSSGDVFIVALTVFALSFAILTGAGINLRSSPAAQELVSLRKVRLLISLGLAVIAAVGMMRKK